MSTRALPDTLKLIREYLADSDAIQSFVSSRVYTKLPANPGKLFVMLRRSGGIPAWYGDDRARIDVHCYGRTDDEARELAKTVFKVLMEAPQVHDEGVLTDVKPASDLQELADTTYMPPQPRYIFTILATTHS